METFIYDMFFIELRVVNKPRIDYLDMTCFLLN